MEISDLGDIVEADSSSFYRFSWQLNCLRALQRALLWEYYLLQGSPHDSQINVLETTMKNFVRGVSKNDQMKTQIGQKAKEVESSLKEKFMKEAISNFLMHCWYSEGAIDFPHSDVPMFIFDESRQYFKERMTFAYWKIVKMYYSVFSSTQAILKSIDQLSRSHGGVIESFNVHALGPLRGGLFVFPFDCWYNERKFEPSPSFLKHKNLEKRRGWGNFTSDLEMMLRTTWKWELDRKYESYKKSAKRDEPLKYKDSKKHPENNIYLSPVSFLNCLRRFREWVNYKEVKPFIIRPIGNLATRKELDISITWVTCFFNMVNELYLIFLMKSPWILKQIDCFTKKARDNLGYDCAYLQLRRKVYAEEVLRLPYFKVKLSKPS